jgi:hypothetical protein
LLLQFRQLRFQFFVSWFSHVAPQSLKFRSSYYRKAK